MRILITGINGFVGKALSYYLLNKNYFVQGVTRNRALVSKHSGLNLFEIKELNQDTNWQEALVGVDAVVHLASTVHRPDITDATIYQETITAATINLAKQAQAARVKRFIFLSTSHVYGIEACDTMLTEDMSKQPNTPYGKAKLDAEEALVNLVALNTMEIVIVRSPLVYGKGVKGNFLQLTNLVKKYPCLPLASANKKRSFIYVENLVDFIHSCLVHDNAGNKIFNISDDNDLSTYELCQLLQHEFQRKLYFISVSPFLIKFLLKLIGRESLYNKLFESVRLDISYAKRVLDWSPKISVAEGLKRTLAE